MNDQTLPKPNKSNSISTSDSSKIVPITKPKELVIKDNKKSTSSSGISLPPTSLTALSSMSSNTIPTSMKKASKLKSTTLTPQANSSTKPVAATQVNKTSVIKPSNATKSVNSDNSAITSSESKLPKPSASTTQINKTVNPELAKDTKSSIATTVKQPTTVLGRPLPQTMRGEETPKGLNSVVHTPIKTTQEVELVAPSTVSTPAPAPQANKVNNSKPTETKKPEVIKEKKSILRFLPLALGIIVLLTVGGLILNKIFATKKSTSLPKTAPTTQPENDQVVKRTEVVGQETEITYWGLWEPSEVLEDIISDFEKENVGIKIKYIKQSPKNYRERLQTALSNEETPDLFRFHASWTPMLKKYLSPIPSSLVSAKEFKDNYYPVVSDQLVSDGQFVGVPLMYDGLALFYNEDILKTANVTPPSTWAELRLLAQKLTVKSATGIERAGLAIGNAENVEHFSDILAVLMLQNGADFTSPNSQETKDALLFYTNFVTKDEVWSNKLPNSTIAFARGDVAMMFAPSWRAHEIVAQNPSLKFKTMTLPQLSDKRVAWASYWSEGINAKSKNQAIAASFLSYLNSDENLKKLYSKASETRSFGEIYPKISMAEELANDTTVSSYLDDALYAKSWYLNSFTHDNGINDQMIKYYRDAVTSIIQHEKIEDVIETLDAGVSQVLRQYKIK